MDAATIAAIVAAVAGAFGALVGSIVSLIAGARAVEKQHKFQHDSWIRDLKRACYIDYTRAFFQAHHQWGIRRFGRPSVAALSNWQDAESTLELVGSPEVVKKVRELKRISHSLVDARVHGRPTQALRHELGAAVENLIVVMKLDLALETVPERTGGIGETA